MSTTATSARFHRVQTSSIRHPNTKHDSAAKSSHATSPATREIHRVLTAYDRVTTTVFSLAFVTTLAVASWLAFDHIVHTLPPFNVLELIRHFG